MKNINNIQIQNLINNMKDMDKEFFYEENCKKIAVLCKDNPSIALDYVNNCSEIDLVYFSSALEYIFELKPSKELYKAIDKRCETIKNEDNFNNIKLDLNFSFHYLTK